MTNVNTIKSKCFRLQCLIFNFILLRLTTVEKYLCIKASAKLINVNILHYNIILFYSIILLN